GGQNMLEPAAYGAAVCYGPNTSNFRQVVELLEQHQASQRVRSLEELTQFVRTMLKDRTQAEEMGQRAQNLILSQQGATARTVEQIFSILQTRRDSSRSAA
ncbi:MAG TPA: 3-deoxy-D-manno-octulosonic acid transferase, partial [Planctomicrobium sp.]|nr:3-deoxy-D-manno-octulosonic acid transferase [Planctomicrobium sp.]